MHRHLLIGRVQVGIITAGLGHAGLGVVGHDELGRAAEELQGVDVDPQPGLHLLIAGGLRVGVRTDAQYGDEQRSRADGTTLGIVQGDGGTRPVDEQFLARPVLLAQHHVLLAAPALVQLAEAAIAVAVWVGLPVLLPKQQQREVAVPLELFVDSRKVGRPPLGLGLQRRLGAEQLVLELRLVAALRQRPAQAGGLGPLQVLMDSGLADRTTAGDLPLRELHLVVKPENFLDLAHGQSPGWQI